MRDAGVLLAGSHVMVVARPPLGLLCAAAYLALWGLSLGVLSIFTLVAAISAPHQLTLENFAIAFGGVPLFQLLGVAMLAAAYGLATCRPWAVLITQVATVAAMAVLVSTVILGAQDIGQVFFNGVSIVTFAFVSWYAGLPKTRRFIAMSMNPLAAERHRNEA